MEEYWIVSPQGAVEIYYLKNGKYVLEYSYILLKDEEAEDYNADTVIHLKNFPHITIKLSEIFEGTE